MNPELPAPQITHESQSASRSSEVPQQTPELVDSQSREREQSMQQVDRQTMPPQTQPVIPVPPLSVPVPVPAQITNDDVVGPTLAADDDLIEKEWVDKAKKIITNTRDDPYQREQEINKLQADYLRKRYGKELGVSN